MKKQSLLIAALVPLLIVPSLIGCDSSDNRRPADAMKVQEAPSTPAKPPSTPEEKIEAIKKSTLPDKEKEAAIERVRSGKL